MTETLVGTPDPPDDSGVTSAHFLRMHWLGYSAHETMQMPANMVAYLTIGAESPEEIDAMTGARVFIETPRSVVKVETQVEALYELLDAGATWSDGCVSVVDGHTSAYLTLTEAGWTVDRARPYLRLRHP